MVEQAIESVNLKNADNLMDTFNSYFEGSAEATISNGNRLEITIGSQTLLISLLDLAVVGAQAKVSS